LLPETMIWKGDHLLLLDQRLLPWEKSYCSCKTFLDVAEAIEKLCVRGAPAIGISAAYGVFLAAKKSPGSVPLAIERLRKTRPTAVNLFWALKRMEKVFKAARPDTILYDLEREALSIHHEDIEINKAIGEYGVALLPDPCTILTHCNAGALATGGHGTALGIVRTAAERKNIKVFADETRPVLQGARLTVWELMQDGIDVTLICDDMAGSLMQSGTINAVIVGADRIAANGDVANKIGTYQLAVMCKYHSVPFYVAAPLSTFDRSIPSGKDIPIEERAPEEILDIGCFGRLPGSYSVYNPAFDITPASLVSAIITEKGLIMAPVSANIDGVVNGFLKGK